MCRFCDTVAETSGHLLKECSGLEEARRRFRFTSENPKKGPDIAMLVGLADHLGIWDLVVATTENDQGPDVENDGEI